MLQTIPAAGLTAFRAALMGVFATPGSERHVRTLTTPGGVIRRAELLWHPDPGLWAYFHPTEAGANRWLCWYGLTLGAENRPLAPSIEINLAFQPDNKQAAGRALTGGAAAGFFLGHKGGLGGGRGGQMAGADFDRHIRGFVREPIQLGAAREESVFVIGNLEAPDFLRRLHSYVSECERLRSLARRLNAGEAAPPPPAPPFSGGFSPEFDVNGTGGGGPATAYEIDRVHARVVNALQKLLGGKAVNATRSEMRPDLYIVGPDGQMQTLFEVKGCSSYQSWFTAIGQLLVYGAGEAKAPSRVLVCPSEIQSPNFKATLAALGIKVVTFNEQPGEPVRFTGLDAALAATM